MIDIKRALNLGFKQLSQYSDTARLDTEILLAYVLQKPRVFLHTHPEIEVTKLQFSTFQKLLARRSLGKPVAYLTGIREFWSLPLKVNEETLIPRPETELLVELTLVLLNNEPQARILDLGTGSGAISLALAKEKSAWQITASDCSEGALRTAQENTKRLGLSNIYFCHSDWFSQIKNPSTFHAIISNPPYIAANDPALNMGDLRYEPQIALVSGKNGLAALEHIIEHSLARLESNGLLLIEHGFDQKLAVTSMLNDYGYKQVQTWQDIQGNNRVSGGRKPAL